MIACPKCGLANLPHAAECFHCLRPLQEAEVAERKKKEWDEMSPALRGDLETMHLRDRKRVEEWKEYLRTNRRNHTLLGMGIFGVPLFLTDYWVGGGDLFSILLLFIGDCAVGAAVGFLVNQYRGGEYVGAMFFGSSYLFVWGLLASGVVMSFSPAGYGILISVFFGFALVTYLGYFFGMHLALKRTDR